MFCITCGTYIPDGTNHCKKCGNPIDAKPIDETESPFQQYDQRYQPYQSRSYGSRIYQPVRETTTRSAQLEAWDDDISFQEESMNPYQKQDGWLKRLKDSLFSNNAAPVSFEFNQYVPSQANFQQKPFAKETGRTKPRYYSAGKRTYERKK